MCRGSVVNVGMIKCECNGTPGYKHDCGCERGRCRSKMSVTRIYCCGPMKDFTTGNRGGCCCRNIMSNVNDSGRVYLSSIGRVSCGRCRGVGGSLVARSGLVAGFCTSRGGELLSGKFGVKVSCRNVRRVEGGCLGWRVCCNESRVSKLLML